MITQERLKEVLNYNPETGKFTNLVPRHFRQKNVPEKVGSYRRDGYLVIKIDKKRYYAHRLAWFYMKGEWPKEFIDHIDRNPSNNKFSNLREATSRENHLNSKKPSHNTSGHKGIGWHAKQGKWRITFNIDGKNRHIGYYETLKEAVEKIKDLRHQKQGEFAYQP